jgi:tetratricopeptide (TPR) repeat protein
MPTEEESSDLRIRRVHGVLRRFFRHAGHGSVKRVEAALEIADGSFRRWRRRGRLELGALFRTLGELEVTPARFWVEVLGADIDPVQLLRRPTGPIKDPVVRRALERWESPQAADAKQLTEEELRTLDALRDDDPGLAVRRAKAALKGAEPERLPRLLAVYGSARRAQARLDEAREAQLAALELAELSGDRVVAADALQRLGVVCAYEGNFHLALLCAKEAGYEHQLTGNLRGEGRSWVDQGESYFYLGQLDRAIAAFERALACLPEDEVRHRFNAYQMQAILYQRQEDLHEALRYVSFAEELGPAVGKGLFGRLIWTKAEIASALADHAQAERCYAEALEIYRTLSPIDGALAAVELARTQLLQGKVEAAYETAKAMSSLLRPLEKNRIVGAVLAQLSRIAFAGRGISARMLEQAAQKIREERARHERRAPPGT